MSIHVCPCCGSGISAPKAELHRSTIKHGDAAALLSPHQTRIIASLMRHPGGLSAEALIASVWANVPEGAPDTAAVGLRVHISEARKKLKAIGLSISADFGVYRLHPIGASK